MLKLWAILACDWRPLEAAGGEQSLLSVIKDPIGIRPQLRDVGYLQPMLGFACDRVHGCKDTLEPCPPAVVQFAPSQSANVDQERGCEGCGCMYMRGGGKGCRMFLGC